MEKLFNKIRITPGPWVLGKCGGTVITTNDTVCEKMKAQKYGHDNFDFYGGEVIAETIKDADAKLLISAIKMLKRLISQNLMIDQLEHYVLDDKTSLLSDIFFENCEIIKELTSMSWKEVKELL